MLIDKGAVDQTLFLAPRDTSSSTMALLTGLVFNTASLRAYYKRGKTGTNTAITLVTTTATGAHTDGGFVVCDATNSPGRYSLDLPDAVCATGADFALVTIGGAANMEDLSVLIELANPITVTNGVISAALNTALAAPTAITSATPTGDQAIAMLHQFARNTITQTATTQILKADDGTTTVATSTVSDNGTTFTRGEFA